MTRFLWVGGAVGLIAYSGFVTSFSPSLSFSAQPSHHLVLLFVTARILAGVLFFVCVLSVARIPDSHLWIAFIIGVGLTARAVLFFSEPILEDDYNRYLVDGALTAHGVNPFRYSPEEIIQSLNDPGRFPLDLTNPDAQAVLRGINHPQIRTIYPPFSQGVFAGAFLLSPWKPWGWKAVILMCDGLVLFLLFRMLRMLHLPSPLVAVYWWNPVVIHEFSNALHMDVLVLPAVLLALMLAMQSRIPSGIFGLAIASGFKVWPLALMPLFARQADGGRRTRVKLLLLGFLVTALVFVPVLVTPLNETLGLVKYASSWTNNQALFNVLHWVVAGLAAPFEVSHDFALGATRIVSGALIVGIAFRLAAKPAKDARNLVHRALLTVAWLFFLSPTQFPWYYTWMVPLAALSPRPSLLLYAVTLPLFQLVYRWDFLVWVQHVPVFLLFLREIISGKGNLYPHNSAHAPALS